MTHRNWGVPPPLQRFPDRYYVGQPVIAYSKRRERIVVFSLVAAAVVVTMWFWIN